MCGQCAFKIELGRYRSRAGNENIHVHAHVQRALPVRQMSGCECLDAWCEAFSFGDAFCENVRSDTKCARRYVYRVLLVDVRIRRAIFSSYGRQGFLDIGCANDWPCFYQCINVCICGP